MGEVGGANIQAKRDKRRSKVLGEEEVAGKLRRVQSDGGTILSQTSHGEPTHHLYHPDKGV